MSPATKTVKLSRPVTAFEKVYSEIVLRPPSAKLFFELGPLTANYRSGSIESTHDLPGVLSSYLERCMTNVDQEAVMVVLTDLTLEDGVRLRRTFTSFFSDAIDAVLVEETAATAAAAAGKS